MTRSVLLALTNSRSPTPTYLLPRLLKNSTNIFAKYTPNPRQLLGEICRKNSRNFRKTVRNGDRNFNSDCPAGLTNSRQTFRNKLPELYTSPENMIHPRKFFAFLRCSSRLAGENSWQPPPASSFCRTGELAGLRWQIHRARLASATVPQRSISFGHYAVNDAARGGGLNETGKTTRPPPRLLLLAE